MVTTQKELVRIRKEEASVHLTIHLRNSFRRIQGNRESIFYIFVYFSDSD
jgi:hypothetical protein